jgi:hypothetical protein
MNGAMDNDGAFNWKRDEWEGRSPGSFRADGA